MLEPYCDNCKADAGPDCAVRGHVVLVIGGPSRNWRPELPERVITVVWPQKRPQTRRERLGRWLRQRPIWIRSWLVNRLDDLADRLRGYSRDGDGWD